MKQLASVRANLSFSVENGSTELKPLVEKFIKNNYFDKDVFDFDDDE